jgi:hypothetical protein
VFYRNKMELDGGVFTRMGRLEAEMKIEARSAPSSFSSNSALRRS